MQPSLSASSPLPLRNRSFLILLAFRIQIVLAYQIIVVVVGWHIYELTHDALALGLIGLAEVIPYFCCALFAGYAVDHYSRRMFGVLAALVISLNALVLAEAPVTVQSNPSMWIYGLDRLRGPGACLHWPILHCTIRADIAARPICQGYQNRQFGFSGGTGDRPCAGVGHWLDGPTTTAYAVSRLRRHERHHHIIVIAHRGTATCQAHCSILQHWGRTALCIRQSDNPRRASARRCSLLVGGAVAMLPAFIRVFSITDLKASASPAGGPSRRRHHGRHCPLPAPLEQARRTAIAGGRRRVWNLHLFYSPLAKASGSRHCC